LRRALSVLPMLSVPWVLVVLSALVALSMLLVLLVLFGPPGR
jgi:hypothetical protein